MKPGLQTDIDEKRLARAGFFYALAAYITWGFMPLYYVLLKDRVNAYVIVGHRILWTIVFLILLLSLQRRWGEVTAAIRTKRTLIALLASAALIGGNWVIFVYSIVSGQITHAALGYYINPLVSVLLGMLFLRERMRPTQWFCILLAAVGVVLATRTFDALPWISLSLAFSFGLYGLIRKVVPVGATIGLMIETTAVLPAAAAYLLWTWADWTHPLTTRDIILLIASGVVTALPLIWFSAGARRLKLSTLGFMQYIAPTAQLFVAAAFLGEPLIREGQTYSNSRLFSFTFIWIALAIFSYDGLRAHRIGKGKATAPVEMVE